MNTTELEIREILTVIVVANLFFILGLGVNNDLRKESGEDIFEEFRSHDHLGPVMTLLQDIQHIT